MWFAPLSRKAGEGLGERASRENCDVAGKQNFQPSPPPLSHFAGEGSKPRERKQNNYGFTCGFDITRKV